jgi:hypothetical protein
LYDLWQLCYTVTFCCCVPLKPSTKNKSQLARKVIDEGNVALKFAKKQAGIIHSIIIGWAIAFTLLLLAMVTVFLSGGKDANGNITALFWTAK